MFGSKSALGWILTIFEVDPHRINSISHHYFGAFGYWMGLNLWSFVFLELHVDRMLFSLFFNLQNNAFRKIARPNFILLLKGNFWNTFDKNACCLEQTKNNKHFWNGQFYLKQKPFFIDHHIFHCFNFNLCKQLIVLYNFLVNIIISIFCINCF